MVYNLISTQLDKLCKGVNNFGVSTICVGQKLKGLKNLGVKNFGGPKILGGQQFSGVNNFLGLTFLGVKNCRGSKILSIKKWEKKKKKKTFLTPI